MSGMIIVKPTMSRSMRAYIGSNLAGMLGNVNHHTFFTFSGAPKELQ
jgi:hypothetical protein